MRNKTLSVFICAFMLVGLSAPLLFSSNEYIMADMFRDDRYAASEYSYIWHDDCSNTTGWTNHTEWGGYTEWGTASGTLESDGDAVYCPTNSGFDSGPFWFKEFPARLPREEFARWDFQVNVTQPSVSYKGDIMACLYDDAKLPVFAVHFHSWDDLNSNLYINLHYCNENGTSKALYSRPSVSNPDFDGVCSIYYESETGLVAQIGTEGSEVLMTQEEWTLEPARNISYIGIQWRRGSGSYLDYFVHDIVVAQGYEPSSPVIAWHDDCSNTTGWTNHTEWDGYTRWDTASGTLASNGEAIHCPTNDGYATGPFWFKEFPTPFTTDNFTRWDFQVYVNQPSGSYKGDLWAGLLDDEKQPVMVIQLLSWDDLIDDLYIYLHYRCENSTWLYYERPSISIPNFDGVCSFYYEPGIGLVGQIGTEGAGVLMSDASWNSEPARNISYIGIQWRRGSGTYLDYFVHDILVTQGYEPVDPLIDSPPDITYEFGTTGHNITWTPSSASPDHYEIYQTLELIASGPWNGSQVSISVDGLIPDIYIYYIFVFNDAGYFAFDWVLVTVTGTTATTTTTETTTVTTTPSQFDIMVLTIAIGSMAVIVVIAGVICRSGGAVGSTPTGQSGYRW